jgi:hypothetical protein
MDRQTGKIVQVPDELSDVEKEILEKLGQMPARLEEIPEGQLDAVRGMNRKDRRRWAREQRRRRMEEARVARAKARKAGR